MQEDDPAKYIKTEWVLEMCEKILHSLTEEK
jgi:hypothetical protein